MTSIQTKKIARLFSFLVSVSSALFLVATVVSAQDANRSTRTGPQGLDGKEIRGYDEYTGPYGQFGITIGATDGDGRTPDTDAQGGFNLTGGYRVLPWLSAEANFIFMRGELDGNFNNRSRDANYFSFTFGPKIYPLALIEDQPIPEQVQPYMLIAIGGGEYEIEDTRFDESTFIARFIWGFDWWLTDQFGAFVEGGYHVASDSDIDGSGVFTFGGQVRF